MKRGGFKVLFWFGMFAAVLRGYLVNPIYILALPIAAFVIECLYCRYFQE